jgi:shikimate kinase
MEKCFGDRGNRAVAQSVGKLGAQKNIVLVGFMGTGKTTIGRRLAERLQWTFADTDASIEQRAGARIPEIFAQHGEAYFRQLEEGVIKDIMLGSKQVVATGGGAVLAETNRLAMLGGGFVVALTATPETIIDRVKNDKNRPLLQGNVEDRVHSLLEQRKEAYGFAHLMIDTTSLDEEEIVSLILAAY